MASGHLEAAGLRVRPQSPLKGREAQLTSWGQGIFFYPENVGTRERFMFLTITHSFDKHTPSTFHVRALGNYKNEAGKELDWVDEKGSELGKSG